MDECYYESSQGHSFGSLQAPMPACANLLGILPGEIQQSPRVVLYLFLPPSKCIMTDGCRLRNPRGTHRGFAIDDELHTS